MTAAFVGCLIFYSVYSFQFYHRIYKSYLAAQRNQRRYHYQLMVIKTQRILASGMGSTSRNRQWLDVFIGVSSEDWGRYTTDFGMGIVGVRGVFMKYYFIL